MSYIYRVKSKYLKNDCEKLNKFFRRYESENQEDVVYAIPYVFRPESLYTQVILNTFNSPKWQSHMHLENPEIRDQMEQDGLKFEEVVFEDGHSELKLIESEELLKELGTALICVEASEPETKGYLFIASNTDGDEGTLCLYDSNFLEDAQEVLKALIKEGVVYKSLSPREKAKRRAKKAEKTRADA